MKHSTLNNPVLLVFLSHLSGDEGDFRCISFDAIFLSHLSGDEVLACRHNPQSCFLSHLSGDEDRKIH